MPVIGWYVCSYSLWWCCGVVLVVGFGGLFWMTQKSGVLVEAHTTEYPARSFEICWFLSALLVVWDVIW